MTQNEHESIPLLASLPHAEITALLQAFPPREYPAGVMLFREGELGDRLYVVLAGEITIFKQVDATEERPMGVRGVGEFVGEMSFLSVDGRRSASARVEQAARLLELTRADFEALLRRHPELAYEMLRTVSDRLRESNTASIHDLRTKNQQLAQAYHELEAAQAQLVERERFAHEMELAREIQAAMRPRTLPLLAGFELNMRIVPAREVAGDFYDIFQLGPDRVALVIADVCGKGVPSALYMAQTRGLIRVEAGRYGTAAEVLLSVNRYLIELTYSDGLFVTALLAVLDTATGEVELARAGHELPLMRDAAGSLGLLARGLGHPLGILEDPAIDTQRIVLAPGAALLLFTDGVTEASNAAGELFGAERLLETVRHASSAQELCDRTMAAIERFRDNTPQADDITLVALQAL